MMWGYGGGMGWGAILMTISMLLVLGLIGYGLVALVRYLNPRSSGTAAGVAGAAGSGPEQLLASRFAAGEIDEQEYRHRLDILRDGTRPASRN
jgi:putative membrane protein